LRLKKFCKKILVIDDLANREHYCDLLIDQNIVKGMYTRYESLIPEGAQLLIGLKYALLNSSYLEAQKNIQKSDRAIRRILISFGGADEYGLTKLTLLALLQLKNYRFDIDIVLSSVHRDISSIKEIIKGQNNIVLHSDLPTLSELMVKSDLAIGGGGTTSWERLCLGLKSITITVADNQINIANCLNDRGLTHWVGHYDQVGEQDIARAVSKMVADGAQKKWSEASVKLVDGKGVDRVCDIISINSDSELRVRNIDENDKELILTWANDLVVRANSLNTEKIEREAHEKWFNDKLIDTKNSFYLVYSHGNVAVGTARFEQLEDNVYEVHYSVPAIYRGLGLGVHVLKTAIKVFCLEKKDVVLMGQIKKENIASRRIFQSIGFKMVPAKNKHADSVHVYRLNCLKGVL